MSTINFVTFDDGLTYVAISEIESFGHEEDVPNYKGKSWIKLRNGHRFNSSWTVSELAEKLAPCANLHY